MSSRTPLLTVGHGTLPATDFAELLTSAGVELVVDVRRFPASRRHPHFARPAMESWLPASGVQYRWEERLGGRRRAVAGSPNLGLRDASFRAYADYMETPEFTDALERVVRDAEHRRVTVMCAESLWWRCHRRLIADNAVLLRDTPVGHLFHDGTTKPHEPTAEAQARDGVLRYEPVEPTLL